MSSVTHHSLRFKCRVRGCPWPKDEAIHIPWCLGIDVEHWADKPTHQHYPKKGMGGNNPKSKIVAILCVTCHDRIDNGTDWGNAVVPKEDGKLAYWAFDLHGKTLIEKDLDSVLSAAAEAAGGEPRLPPPKYSILQSGEKLAALDDGSSAAAPSAGGADRASSSRVERQSQRLEYVGSNPTWPDSAPSPTKEERDADTGVSVGRDSGDGDRPVDGGGGNPSNLLTHEPPTKEESDGQTEEIDGGGVSVRLVPGGADGQPLHHSPSSTLTHEQRVAIAQAIKDTEWNRQWHAGDVGNAWIAEMGEEAEQYLSDFGYVHESLANILRVCAAIPPPYRNGNLRFSHHVVVAGENLEDVEMHLAECAENQWSVAEFRRRRKGTKPRVKRWSLEELRECFSVWLREPSSPAMPHAKEFLDWLEEQA